MPQRVNAQNEAIKARNLADAAKAKRQTPVAMARMRSSSGQCESRRRTGRADGSATPKRSLWLPMLPDPNTRCLRFCSRTTSSVSRLAREEALNLEKPSFAWPVCCSVLFGECLRLCNSCGYCGQAEYGHCQQLTVHPNIRRPQQRRHHKAHGKR